MCGIVGAIAEREVREILTEGLKRLNTEDTIPLDSLLSHRRLMHSPRKSIQ